MRARIQRFIKTALHRAGIDLRRADRPVDLDRYQASDSAGLIIEFMGMSGVGKSTLFNQTMRGLTDIWFFENHARCAHVPKNCAPAHEQAIKQAMLGNYTRWAGEDANIETWADVFIRQTEVAQISARITGPHYPRGFALDEGLTHYFAEQIIAADHDMAAALTMGRAFVYVRAPSLEQVGRQSAQQRGQPTPDAPLSDKSRRMLTAMQDIYDQLWARIQTLGCECILIDLGDGVAQNRAQILAFEAGLRDKNTR